MTFDCEVALPGWRLHVAEMTAPEGRELGNVMDVAVRGAFRYLLRRGLDQGLERSPVVCSIREALRRLGLDPESTPPCSETLISGFLENGELPRGSIAWEFLAVLTAKSQAPWSAFCRAGLKPPLVFRLGDPEEMVVTSSGTHECDGLPVLADRNGAKGSYWVPGHPRDLQDCADPVFVCYLPGDLFRSVDPKSHLGRTVWLTWALRFVFERSFAHGRTPA